MNAHTRPTAQRSIREFAPIREALHNVPDVPRHILQHLDRLEERYARALEEVGRWQSQWAAVTNHAQRSIEEAHARSADCAEHGREIIYLRERVELLEAELDQERDMRAHLSALYSALRDAVHSAQNANLMRQRQGEHVSDSLNLSLHRVEAVVKRIHNALARVRRKTDKKREAIYARTERALKEMLEDG